MNHSPRDVSEPSMDRPAPDPFDAPTSAPAPRPPNDHRAVRLVLFLLRRAGLGALIPITLLTPALLLFGEGKDTVCAVLVLGTLLFLAAFLPASLVTLYDRFVAPVTDPCPVVLATGIVMDRARFRRWSRLDALERLVPGPFIVLALFALAYIEHGFGADPFAWVAGLAGVALALLFPWMARWTWRRVRLTEALVAHAQGDFPRALALLEPLARRRPRAGVDMAISLELAAAHRALGAPETALAILEPVRGLLWVQARFFRARLLAGLGRVEEAREALSRGRGRNLGQRLSMEAATALLDLEEGRPADVLTRARSWDVLRDGYPTRIRGELDLIEAAAWGLSGEPERAANVLRRTGTLPSDLPWAATSMPRVWAAVKDLPVSAPEGAAPAPA